MPEIGRERLLGGLLKTEQVTQYAGYLDDGYYQKGLSKLYTILTAGQYAGTTSITLYNKTDLISNNCVYDRRTKLMWARYYSDGLGTGSNGKLPWTTDANGQGIFALAAAANLAKLGGYSDWRIPNSLELMSLISAEKPTAAPDATAFPVWSTTDYLWTSTTKSSGVVNAMVAYFSAGGLSDVVKTAAYLAPLVRGG